MLRGHFFPLSLYIYLCPLRKWETTLGISNRENSVKRISYTGVGRLKGPKEMHEYPQDGHRKYLPLVEVEGKEKEWNAQDAAAQKTDPVELVLRFLKTGHLWENMMRLVLGFLNRS